MPLGDRLLADLCAGWGATGGPVGIAVSGGGDSIALLHLMVAFRAAGGPALHAVTMDHRLRAEAAAEAAQVADLCRTLDVPHTTLHWNAAPQGNLMQAAREARYRAIADWARGTGTLTVLLGHTRDDVAETFLMRLARGSGVDGLAGMARSRAAQGVTWLRPLLDVPRATLRAYLHEIGATWVDDPTNDDPAHDRTHARRALEALAPLGITADRIAETAAWMALARDALDRACLAAEGAVWRQDAGDLLLDGAAFAPLPMETQLRLLAAGVCWVAAQPYRPRKADLLRLHAALLAGPCRRTLAGALITRQGNAIRLGRELRAVAGTETSLAEAWDGRWHLTGPPVARARVRALGAGGMAVLRGQPDIRPDHLPRASLLASPAVWQDETLISAPLAGLSNGYSVEIRPSFAAALLAH